MARRSVFLAVISLIIIVNHTAAETPYHAWSQSFGDFDADRAVEMAVDDYGNLYVTGYFLGSIDLGGGVLTSNGGWDIFLAKYAPDGTHLWSQRYGSASSDYVNGISVDRFGFVSIVGRFPSTIDLGGGNLTSAGGYDIFAAKYSPDGVHLWSRQIGGTGTEVGTGVTIDELGNTIIVAYFVDPITIESITHTSQGSDDILVVKFDTAGNVLWSQSYGGTDNDYAANVVADAGGHVIISAYGYSSIDFGSGAHPRIGSLDVYLAKFDRNGVYQWSDIHGGPSSDTVAGLAVDGDDNILVAGYFYVNADFGGGPIASKGGTDVFVAKYDQSGAHIWSSGFGGSAADLGLVVTSDNSSNVYLSGYMTGTASFGGNPLTSIGLEDIFVARYTPGGGHVWSRNFGGTAGDQGTGLAADPFGNVLMFAEFKNAMDAGGGPLFSYGGFDVVLAKFYHGPGIHSVLDVPADQGGLVNVAWDACTGDNATDQAITDYTVWRAIDATTATNSLDSGVARIDDASQVKAVAPEQPLIRVAGAYYWYRVGTVEAIALENYSYPTATLFDSTGTGSDYHYFQVIAHTADPYVYYPSEPDSGYSVDNLAPSAPQNLVAVQTASPPGLELTWNANDEPDLLHYAVFRGTDPGFVADSGSLLAESPDTTAFDATWQWDGGYWYKVFAVDIHGNMSPYTMIGPDLVTGIGGPALRSARLEQNVPNPFNPSTSIAFTIAEAGDVSLRVYDPAGRLIRTLVHGHRDAEKYTAAWYGRNDAGEAVASGVYFYRLTAPGFVQTRRMVLLK